MFVSADVRKKIDLSARAAPPTLYAAVFNI